MKKLILILCVCVALTLCFVACDLFDGSQDNVQTEEEELTAENLEAEEITEPVSIEIRFTDEKNDELNSFFYEMQSKVALDNKIEFIVDYQYEYYKLNEKGTDEDDFASSLISINIYCDYSRANDEEWYQPCNDKNYKTLNEAFFNEYSDELSEGHFYLLEATPALYFKYEHSGESLSMAINDFNSDYDVLKKLAHLKYVKYITVRYIYGLPNDWFAE